VRLSFVGVFALLHGFAHGVELNGGEWSATIGGFIAATALLHGIGVLLAQRWSSQRPMLYRITGFALSAIGVGLLFN
jgi:urease accessory protein